MFQDSPEDRADIRAAARELRAIRADTFRGVLAWGIITMIIGLIMWGVTGAVLFPGLVLMSGLAVTVVILALI